MSVEDEIILPGVVGGAGAVAGGPGASLQSDISLAPSIPADTEVEVQSDDEEVWVGPC